ncbi:MAG: formate dehydrogenase subunit alpha [Halodesulfurarchaeum sp.]
MSQATESITVEIDGRTIDARPDQTVLEVAREHDIDVPTLCHMDELEPTAACRTCLVENQETGDLAAACAQPVEDGLSIETHNDRLYDSRRTTIELLLEENCVDCLTCEKRGDCELADLAYEYDVDLTEYGGEGSPFPTMDDNPYFELDHDKCILCGRCVRTCEEIRFNSAIGTYGRGMETRVGPPLGRSLTDGPCEFCGDCVDACPTDALVAKDRIGRGRESDLETTETICAYCGVGCRLELKTDGNEIVDVSPLDDPDSAPANGRRLCVKGRFGFDFVNDEERLEHPLIKEGGEFREATWEEALEYTAENLQSIADEHGADAIATLASATCTNEENYVFQKFVRSSLGTNNVDHCARLCHASTVAGLGQAFGSGAMTNSIEEIQDADVILVTGSNTTEAHPVIGREIIEASRNGATLVVVDPREIKLAREADIHLRQRSGSDVAWIMSLVSTIIEEDRYDETFVEDRTEGFEELRDAAAEMPPERAADVTGIDESDLREVARIYAEADRAMQFYAMGITQHSNGTDNVLALANLAMLTGNVGKRATGVNPLRGQNNVQGACDLGALPDVHTGYRDVADPETNEAFEAHWGTDLPTDPGLTVVEMFDAARFDRVKGMYVMGENPLVSDPHLRHVEEGVENLDFLVVQDIFLSDTAEYADVVLPAASFAEKDGTFTNTERRVQAVNQAIDPIGESKPDWQIVAELSQHFEYSMDYENVEEITREIAEVTPMYGGIVPERIDERGIQWPSLDEDHPGTPILHEGEFAQGLGSFAPVRHRDPDEIPDEDFPFRLTTGRILYHFHTRTMTGRSRPLTEHVPDPYVEVHPDDADALSIEDGESVRVSSPRGSIEIPVFTTDRVPTGTIFIPFHFAEAAANRLTNPTLDPASKIPELKVSKAKIESIE